MRITRAAPDNQGTRPGARPPGGALSRAKKKRNPRVAFSKFGAGNRVRTGDLNLGKVALYQLSYSRKMASRRGVEPLLPP